MYKILRIRRDRCTKSEKNVVILQRWRQVWTVVVDWSLRKHWSVTTERTCALLRMLQERDEPSPLSGLKVNPHRSSNSNSIHLYCDRTTQTSTHFSVVNLALLVAAWKNKKLFTKKWSNARFLIQSQQPTERNNEKRPDADLSSCFCTISCLVHYTKFNFFVFLPNASTDHTVLVRYWLIFETFLAHWT